MQPRLPDFFIVGAPRCGTTALFTYLRQHPDIFMPDLKEPNFFCSDLGIRATAADRAEYLSLFRPGIDKKRVGEASVWYLYSARAAAAIKAFTPTARIIIMLRQPIDMLYSLHRQRVYSGVETITAFETALSQPSWRRQRYLRLLFREPPAEPFGLDVGRYAKQVARYLEVFGADRVKIILYDDFSSNAAAVYRDVLDYLDVTTTFFPSFEVINSNKQIRNVLLHRLVRRPSRVVRGIARMLVPRRLRPRVAETIVGFNSRPAPRAALPAALRQRLTAELAADIVDLGRLLGRDLTHWLSAQEGPSDRQPGTTDHACSRAPSGSCI